ELVFDGVFDGDDLADGVVDLVERSVERRSFATAGWAGDENDAVRHLEHVLETFFLAHVHAEIVQAAQRGILAEQTHHHRLAMQHRNHGDADVHLGIVHADFDSTVLGKALLGNVEVAQDFYARHDG